MTEEELRPFEAMTRTWQGLSDENARLRKENEELRGLLQDFVDWDQNAEHDPYLLRDCFVRAKEKLGGDERIDHSEIPDTSDDAYWSGGRIGPVLRGGDGGTESPAR